MPHTKKVQSTLPKGSRALKSSTPKRPATSPPPPPPAQVNMKTQREIKATFRPNLPFHHLKVGHLPRISLRIAPQSPQPTLLCNQSSQTDNTTTPKQPTSVMNQSSQTNNTPTPKQPTSLSHQSAQTVITPAKKTDTDTTPDSPDYSLELITFNSAYSHTKKVMGRP